MKTPRQLPVAFSRHRDRIMHFVQVVVRPGRKWMTIIEQSISAESGCVQFPLGRIVWDNTGYMFVPKFRRMVAIDLDELDAAIVKIDQDERERGQDK